VSGSQTVYNTKGTRAHTSIHTGKILVLGSHSHGEDTRGEGRHIQHRSVLPLLSCRVLCSYMLNMRSEEENTVFYSHFARVWNMVTLNMNIFLSNAGFTRRNTAFRFVWLHPRNT